MEKKLFPALLLLTLGACGEAAPDRCSLVSRCSADPARTSGDFNACEDAEKNPPKCHAEKAAFDDCFLTRAVCGSDHKTDPLQTFMACSAEADAFAACSSK